MHDLLCLSPPRRNRPKVSALGRVRLAGLPLDRLCCSSCRLGSDGEIVVKPRPGQRAERGCWSPETCPKFVYIFKLGLEATSGCLTDEPVAEIVQCGEPPPK